MVCGARPTGLYRHLEMCRRHTTYRTDGRYHRLCRRRHFVALRRVQRAPGPEAALRDTIPDGSERCLAISAINDEQDPMINRLANLHATDMEAHLARSRLLSLLNNAPLAEERRLFFMDRPADGGRYTGYDHGGEALVSWLPR